jgi:hypothetical protein
MLVRPLFGQLQIVQGGINVFHCLYPVATPLRSGMLELAFRISQGLFRTIHFSRSIVPLEGEANRGCHHDQSEQQ